MKQLGNIQHLLMMKMMMSLMTASARLRGMSIHKLQIQMTELVPQAGQPVPRVEYLLLLQKARLPESVGSWIMQS